MSSLGHPWFVNLPDGWTVQPFKRMGHVRNGQVDPRRPEYCDLPLYAPNHIESGTGRLLGIETAAEQGADSGKYPVRSGELVYSKIRPALRKLIIAPDDGLCSADMYAVSPAHGVSARFLFWAMLSEGFSSAAVLASDRVAMPKVNRETLADFPLPLPPISTQKAIAAFLDRKTAAIDALIEKKQKLLDLLAEKRAALINHAVTKGLDPNVPLKDSGVPWIGEIPAHWEVKKLSWLLNDGPRNGVSPSVSHDGSGVPSFSLSVVRDGVVELREDDVKYVLASDSDARRFNVTAGDLLLVRGNGNINLVGATGLVGDDMLSGYVYPDLLMRMRCGDGVYPGYVRYCINSDVVRPQLTASARTTVGTYKVNNEQVRELRLLAPPESEAAAISEHLDVAIERHGDLVGAVEEHIERLREYRQALITAAVTGQLDIGEEAA